ncbi:MAG TPA: hypothetical protein VK582_07610 [Pyrinomonadaceae bacterium]|nr:hypothetical protein [Pyrinomonadaceae bacterium]
MKSSRTVNLIATLGLILFGSILVSTQTTVTTSTSIPLLSSEQSPAASTPMTLLDTITGPNTELVGDADIFHFAQARFLGNAWTNDALPLGTTSITITGLTFYVNAAQNESYSKIVARFAFWNRFDGGTDPIFSNGTLVSFDLGPQNFSAGSKNKFSVTLPTPVTLTGGPKTNWWGVTQNIQGTTVRGGGPDLSDLAPVIVYRKSGNYPAGTITAPGIFPKFGWYKTTKRTDFNFSRSDGLVFTEDDLLAEGLAIIISGTANTGPVPTPTPTPSPSPSPKTITLTVPTSPVVVPATNSSGALVQYNVSAVDTSGVTPTINCAPPPGNFPVGFTTVTCTATGPSGSQTKSFLVTVTSLSKRFTPEQKKQFEHIGTQLHIIDGLIHGIVFTTPELGPYEIPLTLVGLTCMASGFYLDHLAADPPDSNYTSIIQPVPLKYQPVLASNSVPAAVANAFNALLENQAQAAGLAQAVFITNNRADGAMEAHDAGWEQKQMQAAAGFAAQLSALLAAQPQLLVNLQNALSANGFPATTVTQSQLESFKASVIQNGLPASMIQQLTQMGVDQATINNIRGLISTQDVTPGVFPAVLSDASTQDALRGAAQGLTAFSLNNVAGLKTVNAADNAQFFVTQHYFDFLNRSADASGLAFWTNQITSCGTNQPCTEVRRINTSGAFFLSIEFQETGYLVERMYKTAYGSATGISTFAGVHQLPVPVVRFDEFSRDLQRIGQGVVVLQLGWEQLLEANKQAYANEFVQTPRFIAAFPTTMTPAQFVDQMNQNAGNVLSATERTTAINLFAGASNTSNVTSRAQAVRKVAENANLAAAEKNRAFVLAQYFGYLRRDPNSAPDSDYTGYDFWLNKLNQFNGDFIAAEMVKAFISSTEYRGRFGP